MEKRNMKKIVLCCTFIFHIFTSSIHSEEEEGTILYVKGNVTIIYDGKTVNAEIHNKVSLDAIINSLENGEITIKYKEIFIPLFGIKKIKLREALQQKYNYTIHIPSIGDLYQKPNNDKKNEKKSEQSISFAGTNPKLSEIGDKGLNRNENYTEAKIRIVNVKYGMNDKYCDATSKIKEMCEGKSCKPFTINNDLCGDPLVGPGKKIIIKYNCITDEDNYLYYGNENEVANIKCN